MVDPVVGKPKNCINNSNDLAVVTKEVLLLVLLICTCGLSTGNEEDVVDSTLSWAGTWCPPPLPVIKNSNLSYTAGVKLNEADQHVVTNVDYSPPGSRLMVACDNGYRLEASRDNVLECKAGRWTSSSSASSNSALSNADSARMPECQAWCQRPTVSQGDIENSDAEYAPGTKVELRCNEGYRLSNKFVNTLQCGSDGKWSGHNGEYTRESPHCVPATCPPLAIASNSILEYRGTTGWDGGFHEGSRVSYACRQGFKLTFEDGTSTDRDFECRNGIWQNLVQVTCELVGCGPPPSIFEGEVVDDRSSNFIDGLNEAVGVGRGGGGAALPLYPVGMRIGYRCNPGYVLVGPSKRYRCSAKGHWVPTRLPTCRNRENDEQKSQDCSAPPMISRARLENATVGPYPPNSAVFYVCDEGFLLEGLPNLICDQSGQWQPRPGPTCRPNIILPEDCLKPGPPSKINDVSRGNGLLVEGGGGRQMVPLLVGTLVSAVLLTVLLAVQLTRKGGWKYLSGWTSSGVPMCRNSSDDVIIRGVGSGVGGGNGEHTDRSASSLLYCEPDRVALLNGVRGHSQVLPPTYEEAIQESQGGHCGVLSSAASGPFQPSDVYGYGCSLLPTGRNRCYRFANLRNGGFAPPTALNDGLNPAGATRHSSISQSACGRSSSVADSLNSTDTVTPSEVSTTVTVDTLSSNASSHPTSSISTRAFCGSLASFDTAESDSALNMEGVPLLEETEMEQGGISPSAETRTVLET